LLKPVTEKVIDDAVAGKPSSGRLTYMDVGEGVSRERKLRALTRAFPQVFLRGKGNLSMDYNPYPDCPSPEPPSHEFIQRFLISLAKEIEL